MISGAVAIRAVEFWSLIGIGLVGVALTIGFWDAVPWSVVIPEFSGLPILLVGRGPHPG